MYLALLSETTSADPAVWFVCLLGVGVVFAGLVLLIGIVALMNFLTEKFQKTPAEQDKPKANTQAPAVIENKQEILAAVCAAIAEENGTDISAIRVLSFKKIN
ncbi:MAG: OadG family protein [Clostridia bacterium]|nr:OadG family protein [Clostridia bacterium]